MFSHVETILVMVSKESFKASGIIFVSVGWKDYARTRISYRNGWNTEALIFETLKPVEITKKIFEQHLNTLKKV